MRANFFSLYRVLWRFLFSLYCFLILLRIRRGIVFPRNLFEVSAKAVAASLSYCNKELVKS